MKNTLRCLALSVVALAFVACNFALPQRIVIQSDPAFDLSAGQVTVDLAELGVDLDAMVLGTMAGAFDEAAGDTISSGLVDGVYTIQADKRLHEQPLGNVVDQELDFGAFSQVIEPLTFNVPDIDQTIVQTVTVDSDSLGSLVIPPLSTITLPEIDGTATPPAATVTVAVFDTLTLGGGYLDIAITKTASAGLLLGITDARLLTATDTLLVVANNASAGVPLAVNDSGTLVFPLAGKTLPADLKLQVTLTMSGAAGGNPNFTLDSAASFRDLDIDSATGVDFVSTPNGTAPLDVAKPAELVSATVGTGALVISLSDPGFSGVSYALAASLNLDDGPHDASPTANPNEWSIPLAGVSLSSFSGYNLEYTLTVDGAGADVTLPADISLTADLTISQFSQVVVQADGLDFSTTENVVVDAAVLEYLQAATFDDAYLQLNFTNGLPVDLDVTLTSSVLLSGGPDTRTFTALAPAPVVETINLLIDATPTMQIDFALPGDLVDIGGALCIPVDISVSLTGYNSGTGQLTMTNVVPGTDYSFSGSFELVLTPATITLGAISQSGAFPEAGGEPFDFSALGNLLPAGLNLDGTTSNLLLTSDQTDLDDFNLVLLARYTDGGGVHFVDLLNDANPVSEANFLDPEGYGTPTLVSMNQLLPINLVDLINARASGVEIAYAVLMGGTIINISGGDPEGSLVVNLQLDLPLQLIVTDPTGIEWMPAGADGVPYLALSQDLLGRTQDNDATMDLVFDSLTSLALTVGFTNDMLTGTSVPTLIIRQNSATGSFEKRLPLGTGLTSFDLSAADIAFIENTNPFAPELLLALPPGTLNMNPAGLLTADLSLQMTTDIEYQIDLSREWSEGAFHE
ncbi:MAG: hypothetical protein A2087_03595 [Spirochaetes bacterium GWD1_61_31]|nr:MAG: hypothetical protein A2004_11415 [Spirochaetes bacterium GWC1_61_12]OHD36175.1 MAG: hypothetical protein A2087_03595 [Spirochaetes bacterium GWD1_61_31]OHD43239.1 MAG: hypothetical protein A2Y35_08415 [Spirochaetes bacterium GWE1_60_18]OHD58799.1 MAG: hypothetical protein A2Y32_01250 [Spirochaetes bacterium GWF1_60_12]HAP43322.1 hypothetical protein [Spirochaetaceae bacterium]